MQVSQCVYMGVCGYYLVLALTLTLTLTLTENIHVIQQNSVNNDQIWASNASFSSAQQALQDVPFRLSHGALVWK